MIYQKYHMPTDIIKLIFKLSRGTARRLCIFMVVLLPAQCWATVQIKYFSTAGAGTADGSTWANRAALVSAGAITSTITGFDFSGSDSLICYVGPGTYTVTGTLGSGSFTHAPTASNPLYFHGCDSSGNALEPVLSWDSPMPDWDSSGLPVLATTTNVTTTTLSNCGWRMFKFTASSRSAGAMITGGLVFDWCRFDDTTANTDTSITTANGVRYTNCIFSMSTSNWDNAILLGSSDQLINSRVYATGNSSGNRNGVVYNGSALAYIVNCTILHFPGTPVLSTSASTAQVLTVQNCTIANNSGGVTGSGTANQTAWILVENCSITGNGSGVNNSLSHVTVHNCRVRDGTISISNYPTTFDNYTTAAVDADEYNDPANATISLQDFRIKTTVAWIDRNIGAGQMVKPSTAIGVSRSRVANTQ